MVKFEKVSRVEEVRLSERATANSAGYDFFAVEDVTLPAKQMTRIMTGVKCKMRPYMFLLLANRSSNPSRKGIFLTNGVGIVDADYYDNPDNEGEIGFEFYNFNEKDVDMQKLLMLGQGILITFNKTPDDNATGSRDGGFGSTDNK